MTSNAILVAASNRWIVSRAKELPVFGQLVRYILAATKWCLAVAVLSAVALIFDPNWHLPWYPVGIAGWTFLAIGAVTAFVRVLLVFGVVLLGLAEEN